MSLQPDNVTLGYPRTGYNLPDMVSIILRDADGTGGTLYLNGMGVVNGVDIFDLRLLFTTATVPFTSTPLLRAFRAVPPATNNQSALAQFSKYLDINCQPIVGVAAPPVSLRFLPISGISGNTTVPFLQIVAGVTTDPDYAGDSWRLTLKLRHSITN